MRRDWTIFGPALVLALSGAGCSSSDDNAGANPDAGNATAGTGGASGASGTGGVTASAGAGGATSTGGRTSSNGGSVSAGGGQAGSAGAGGGASGTGGSQTGTGGAPNTDSGAPPPGWKVVWQDEFDGAQGTVPDAAKWVFETGGNGFGNNELEYYTSRPENAAMDGNGFLVITARSESYMGRNYTSARLKTQGKFEHGPGRFEARIKIPKGQGIWPAFWMLGNDIPSAGWPTCGEIDIMENIGREPSIVHGTIHGPGYSGGNGIGAPFSGAAPFADDFHLYAIEWEGTTIRWYVDSNNYETRTDADLPQGQRWVFDHPFFILLNVAVGGQWPGNPDGTTQFPQTMQVDYVRVYDKN